MRFLATLGMTIILHLLNSDSSVQDLPCCLFVQATTAVEECDAREAK